MLGSLIYSSGWKTKLRFSCIGIWGRNYLTYEQRLKLRKLIRLRSYSVYRRITDYYNDGSDAYDMRKPLKRDKQRKTVRSNGENIKVDPSEVW